MIHPDPAPESTAALYVHFPFCASICPYCDFDRQASGFDLIPRYVAALVRQIGAEPAGPPVHSVFFGGGTPSLMAPEQVAAVLAAARARFAVRPGAEVTLEANPGDLTAERVAGYLRAGVNRLSIGVQSLDDRFLRQLGRRHSAAAAVAAYRAARAGGAENVSLDLIYGLPGQSAADWRRTLEAAVALEPDHLSCYLLTVDTNVPMGRWIAQGRLPTPDDEVIAEQYADTQRLLAAVGFVQYEISNWARPGRQSRHNLTYWQDEPYLGVGAGAAGSFGGRRYKWTPRVRRYLAAVEAGRTAFSEEEWPDPLTAAQDFLALGLRLREGVDGARFAARFGRSLVEALGPTLDELRAAGLLEWLDGRLRLTDAALLVSNAVIARTHAALAERWDRAPRPAGAGR